MCGCISNPFFVLFWMTTLSMSLASSTWIKELRATKTSTCRYTEAALRKIPNILPRPTVVPIVQTMPRRSSSMSLPTFINAIGGDVPATCFSIVLTARQDRLLARLGSYRGRAERLDEASVIQSVQIDVQPSEERRGERGVERRR